MGIRQKGKLNLNKLNAWFAELLKEQGAQLYRYKGILDVEGLDQPFVFQGVHMQLESAPVGEWPPGVERANQLVFIGKSLDEDGLRAAFAKCLAAEDGDSS